MQLLWIPNPEDVGGPPSDWTVRFGNSVLTVKQDPEGPYYLEISAPSAAVSVATLDNIDGVDLSAVGDCQVTGEYVVESQDRQDYRQIVGFSGSSFSNGIGRFGGRESGLSGAAFAQLGYLNSGSDLNQDSVSTPALTNGTKFFQRLEKIGDAHKLRIFLDANNEPSEWTVERLSSVGSQASGRIGQYRYQAGVIRLYAFGLGTDGDPAPLAVSVPAPTDSPLNVSGSLANNSATLSWGSVVGADRYNFEFRRRS